jgi:hypothetical protein
MMSVTLFAETGEIHVVTFIQDILFYKNNIYRFDE